MLSRSGVLGAGAGSRTVNLRRPGGRRSGLIRLTTSAGTTGGSSGGIIPPISARLNASCTLLMDSLPAARLADPVNGS